MATIEHLPDSLLGSVMARLGRKRAKAALLVSKRWHRVFLSEPVLWQELKFGAEGRVRPWEATLLRRVGSLVANLTINSSHSGVQAAVMRWVLPARLESLQVLQPGLQLVEALPPFSRLTALCLSGVQATVTGPALLQAIQGLPHLLSLSISISGASMGAGLVMEVASRTQLQQLFLRAASFEQPHLLRQLSALCQLTSLNLDGTDDQARLHPPEPALLPALQCFGYHIPFGIVSEEPGVQVAGCGVDSCTYQQLSPDQCAPDEDSSGAVLHIMSAEADSMPCLLRALRPGNGAALHRLELLVCGLDASTLEHCTQLGTVTQLVLEHCASADWEAALAALLRRAPLLSSLSLQGSFVEGGLPPCIVEYTGLRRLIFHGTGLPELPAGPYLAGLCHLTLSDSSLQQLPPALTAATALTSLEVRFQGPLLPADSLAAVLAELRFLRHLRLDGCDLQHLPAAEGWPGLPALESLLLGSDSLAALPPALQHATSLQQLTLTGGQLDVTAAQLCELLTHLPLLESFSFCNGALAELPLSIPAGLLSLDLSGNKLCSLPAGLASDSLTSLGVGGNSDLCFTRDGVDSLLARLLHLRELQLWSTATPRDVQDYATRMLSRRDD